MGSTRQGGQHHEEQEGLLENKAEDANEYWFSVFYPSQDYYIENIFLLLG